MFRALAIKTVLRFCIAIGLIFLPLETAYAGMAQMTKVAAMHDGCKTPDCCKNMKSNCIPSDSCIGTSVSFVMPSKHSDLAVAVISKNVFFAKEIILGEIATVPLRRPPRA